MRKYLVAFGMGVLFPTILFFAAAANAEPGDSGGDAAGGDGNATQEGEIKLLVPFPNDDPIMVKDPSSDRKGAIFIMEQYVSKFYIFGAGFVSIIAVIWIIIGGYEIMFSGATSAGDLSAGKDKITKALLGLVVVFLSALILHTINPNFFAYTGN